MPTRPPATPQRQRRTRSKAGALPPRRPKRRPRFSVVLCALALFFVGPVVVLVGVTWSNRITPRGIVIHHSALGDAPGADVAANAAVVDAVHARRGFGVFYGTRTYHIGYHYVIRADGTVEAGRPERCRGAHAKGHNDYLGVCVLGNFVTTEPTPRQQQSLARLCRVLMVRYRIPPARVVGHRDFDAAHTLCPGDRFPFARLRRAIRSASPGS